MTIKILAQTYGLTVERGGVVGIPPRVKNVLQVVLIRHGGVFMLTGGHGFVKNLY